MARASIQEGTVLQFMNSIRNFMGIFFPAEILNKYLPPWILLTIIISCDSFHFNSMLTMVSDDLHIASSPFLHPSSYLLFFFSNCSTFSDSSENISYLKTYSLCICFNSEHFSYLEINFNFR